MKWPDDDFRRDDKKHVDVSLYKSSRYIIFSLSLTLFFFFLNDPPPPDLSSLPQHRPLPIRPQPPPCPPPRAIRLNKGARGPPPVAISARFRFSLKSTISVSASGV